jgi:putative two-component system response regulator
MTRRKLLVVDDDEAVLDYLRAKLGSRYELFFTNDSAEVVGLARHEHPDLILCDIDMPGMDGGDVSAALYGDDGTREIPVLFLSALVSVQAQVGGRPAISKSVPVDQLIARIEALIG